MSAATRSVNHLATKSGWRHESIRQILCAVAHDLASNDGRLRFSTSASGYAIDSISIEYLAKIRHNHVLIILAGYLSVNQFDYDCLEYHYGCVRKVLYDLNDSQAFAVWIESVVDSIYREIEEVMEGVSCGRQTKTV